MPIRRLPSHLVDRIAAGEVVERPASVVKELVENSLDAGARRIEVTLAGDGLSRIQVVDDGQGMTPDDMRLAIERHATSKLPGDDLLAIASFGFRGEALPAIASVSDFTLESRPANAAQGWRLELSGGEVLFDGPAGVPPGTRITVEIGPMPPNVHEEVRTSWRSTFARLDALLTEHDDPEQEEASPEQTDDGPGQASDPR